MTKYENISVVQLAEKRFFAWVKAQGLEGIPITFKPRDDDRTKVEIIEIGITLTPTQQALLEAEFPELAGKKV